MTARYRRQRQQHLFASLLGFIGIINLLFFLILFRPARAESFRLEASVESLRGEVQSRRLSVERLEKLNSQLATSAQDRHQLYTRHFIPHDAGWSETLRQLDAMIQRSGVRNSRKDYSISASPQHGLYSVTINMPVTGTYSEIVRLIEDLEDSETFYVINSIDVRGSVQPGVTNVVLGLNLETFFYQ
jgi:Tfp pilus assembly protein PilO